MAKILIAPDFVDLSAYGIEGRQIFICDVDWEPLYNWASGWYAVEFDTTPDVMDFVSRSGNIPAADWAGAFELLIQHLPELSGTTGT